MWPECCRYSFSQGEWLLVLVVCVFGGLVGVLIPSTGASALLQEVASSGSTSPRLGILAKVTHIDSWEPPPSQVSGTF